MAVLQSTSITGSLTMNSMTAGFMKVNAQGAVVMDTNTYLTGITSGQVTTALGYTPYNSSNPSGYISQSTADGRYLMGTTSPSSVNNFTISIGNNGSYSYVQSHSSQPLELNPLGNAVRIAGNVVWHQGNLTNLNQLSNGPGYITSSGSISGNAATATTASNSNAVNGISVTQIFNNMGDNHPTRTSFDASTPSYNFGFRYIQGSGNGPGTGGGQFYSWYIGLGNDYPATGGGSYGAMFAVDRNTSSPYLSVRYNENNGFGSWRRISAGYADSAGSLSSMNISQFTNNSGYITSSSLSSYLPLSGGSMTGDIILPNNTAVSLRNADGSAGFRPDDQWGNIYTWNTSGGYYVDANSYFFRSTGSSNWLTISSGNGAFTGTISASNISTGVNGSHIVQRDGNGYIYANHINFNTPESENPAINSFITSNGDGWSRKSSIAHVRNQLGNYGGWITASALNSYLPLSGGTITSRTYLHQAGGGGGQNLFTGVDAPSSANGRGQFILSSAYSDLVIASSQANGSHGSTLSFTTYNPNNAGDYRKFVINQGNWGGRAGFLDFGFADAARTNPHEYINSTDDVMSLDGYNKRVGINIMSPSYTLDVAGLVNTASGYISVGNPWGTSNSAFFPNGITTAGGTNWIYGYTFIGNAPGNGAGHEFFASGSSNSTGDVSAYGSMRAPIFYDRNDTSYYLDPNSNSNLWKFTAGTMARNDMNPLSVNSPWSTRASQSSQYVNGTMGWGQVDLNTVGSYWGSGFIDTWSNPGNAPGGSSHYVGIQSMHYNDQNGNFHGWQMVCAQEATNRWFLRSSWNVPNRPWVEMIHGGNIGSQSVSYANSAGSASSASTANYANSAGSASSASTAGFASSAYVVNSTNDFRHVNRLPNDWHGLANSWHFNDKFTVGVSSSDYWLSILTVNPWSSYDGSHRQQQLAFGGTGGLSFRYATGPSSWSGWETMITTASIGNQSVSYANNAGNVSSISGALNGNHTWTNINYFRTNQGAYLGSLDSAKLQVFNDNNQSAFMSFHRGGYYAVNFGLDQDNVMRIGGWSAAANRWQLDMSGNMTVAGDVTAFSDARVKENVQTIVQALDKVLQLRGVSYNRTDSDDKKTKIGVIAQETLVVVPEVVNQDNAGMYNVSYGNLAGLFIEAFKEQQKQIEDLKLKLDALTK
jgi:hypothetical protein